MRQVFLGKLGFLDPIGVTQNHIVFQQQYLLFISAHQLSTRTRQPICISLDLSFAFSVASAGRIEIKRYNAKRSGMMHDSSGLDFKRGCNALLMHVFHCLKNKLNSLLNWLSRFFIIVHSKKSIFHYYRGLVTPRNLCSSSVGALGSICIIFSYIS